MFMHESKMGRHCSEVSLLDVKSIITRAVKLALSGGLENGDKEMLMARGNESAQQSPSALEGHLLPLQSLQSSQEDRGGTDWPTRGERNCWEQLKPEPMPAARLPQKSIWNKILDL